jgi:hypothetical protein
MLGPVCTGVLMLVLELGLRMRTGIDIVLSLAILNMNVKLSGCHLRSAGRSDSGMRALHGGHSMDTPYFLRYMYY